MNSFSKNYLSSLTLLLVGFTITSPFSVLAQKEKEKEKEAKPAAELTSSPVPDQRRICKMDVFYNWTPEKLLKIENAEDPLKRYYGTIMDEGFDEEEVRMRLLSRVSAVSTEAMTSCTQTHPERSACLVDRLREISKRFARYDYPRRKMLIEAAERDCYVSSGECISVAVGEIECWGNASPDSPSLADFVPVTFAAPIADDEADGSEVEIPTAEVAPVKKGEVVEVKRKKVLRATPGKLKPMPAKEEGEPSPADKGFNSPFVVE